MDDENTSSKPVQNHPNSVHGSEIAEDHNEPVINHEEFKVSPVPFTDPVGPTYHKTSHKKRNLFIILLILIIAGAAAYWFLLRPDSTQKAAKTDTSTQSNQSNNAAKQTQTEHYGSTNFNLSFDYPKGWEVTDADGTGVLVLRSTPTKLTDASDTEVTGQILMTIRDKEQKLTEFSKGDAEAILDSEKITYAKPTETQRGNTYISFLNYASSSEEGIDGIYITGDNGYKKAQAIPSIDIAKIDPVINITFIECSESDCSDEGQALTISADSWNDNTFSEPVKNLLESLAIQ